MKHQEFKYQLHNTDFHGEIWQVTEPKASIVIVHGMGEHLQRYTHVAAKFTQNNYNVIAYDNFGHGKTSGKRGHNPNFEALLDCIEFNINKAKELNPEIPVFIYGHSMGGNLVINYTLKRKHNLKGVIATSPFLKLAFEPPAWKMFLGKILLKVAPSITLGNEINPGHVSRDPKEVEKYNNDKLVHGKISPNYSLVILETGAWAIDNASTLQIPMFVMHGTDDKIISHKGSEQFCKNSSLAELHLIEGGYHELQNDICKENVLQQITNWLNKQV